MLLLDYKTLMKLLFQRPQINHLSAINERKEKGGVSAKRGQLTMVIVRFNATGSFLFRT